jgi:hypothetical protein
LDWLGPIRPFLQRISVRESEARPVHRTRYTAPRHRDGEPALSRDGHTVHELFRQPPGSHARSGQATGTAMSPVLNRLITPTWAEVDEAREQYTRASRRLRIWQWWFVGMFALYTTLVGILLLQLFVG